MNQKLVVLLVAVFLLAASIAGGAPNAYLELLLNGTPIEGESQVTSQGREDSIECFSFFGGIARPRTSPEIQPIVIRKRIDKSTPLLAKGLGQNEVAQGAFRFFRTDPISSDEVHYLTLSFADARITSAVIVSPDSLDDSTAFTPMYEEITILANEITWTYVDGNVEYTYTNNLPPGSSDLLVVE